MNAKAFFPLASEAWQSKFENTVSYNLADSGITAIRLAELLDESGAVDGMLNVNLQYPDVRGTPRVRELIAAWYGARPEEVLVTVGGAEANFIAIATLIRPGDHVLVMNPGYRQIHGCVLNAGATLASFPLDPDRSWRPDLDALELAATPATRLIAVINPNNPTGSILTDDEMTRIVDVARGAGAWLLADEVFRGTERLVDSVTPSFYNRYERAVCIGSLSKAFRLPGLRLGWLIARPELVERARRRHEYATIATGTLSMYLAETALRPAIRNQLLAQTRALIRDRYDRFHRWIETSEGVITIVEPEATALGFVRYHLDIPSIEMANILRTEGDVLVCPGISFGAERHLRFGFGLDPEYMEGALRRVTEVLRRLCD